MRSLSFRTWCLLALSTLVSGQACCDDYELRAGELGGRMDFGFEVAAQVDFDWDMQFDFDFDWAGWAKIRAATDVTLDFDWSGSQTFRTSTSGDVDDDGVDERVRLVAVAEDSPSDPDRVFTTWRGDKYSFDQDTCYLLWWEGKRIELLSAGCDQAEPALHCVMTRGNDASLSCDVCNDNGACMECSAKQTVEDCISAGEDRLADEPEPSTAEGGSAGQHEPTGGSAGQDQPAGGSPGLAGAGGAAAGLAGSAGTQAGSTATGGSETGGAGTAETGGSTGRGGGTSVSAEWSTCVEEVETIRSEARDCDMAAPLDEDTLCSERLSDVNICWAAIEAASWITSTCSVLEENITCGRMFP